MSILIEGMEMPKPKLTGMVAVYNAYIVVTHNGDAKIVIDNEDKTDSTEYSLVSVPPHGRLIDADELDVYQRAEAAHAEYQEDEDNEYLEGVADGLCEAAKQLSFARTIIPESWEE